MIDKMADIGVIGMAVMGRNLAMNCADKGFIVSVYNRTTSRMEHAVSEASKQGITLHGYPHLSEFVSSLARPRKIIMLVQAGTAVEATIEQLFEVLEPGDIIIDGGNELYSNTDRRIELARQHQLKYMGMGVSGGEEGARHGPSLMPGGDRDTYKRLEPILKKIAAQVGDDACVDYMGNGSAGNYVKMVHNGIEYGDMELLAEGYNFMKNLLGLNNKEMSQIFKSWNNTLELSSYLVEITSLVLKTPYENDYLMNHILDVAGSKGTGLWTAQEAAAEGIPCPTIQTALDSRYTSTFKKLRLLLNQQKNEEKKNKKLDQTSQWIDDVRSALYCSKICSYTQGLMLIKKASESKNYDINLPGVISVWRGGCIIRAALLQKIKQALDKSPQIENLLLDQYFSDEIKKHEKGWRRVVIESIKNNLPIPGLSSSLQYYDSITCDKLPLNLIQAQRDYFGAHTFQLENQDQKLHADWNTGKYVPV